MTNIAICGPQGSGKTTLADAVCNAYMNPPIRGMAVRTSFADTLREEVALAWLGSSVTTRDVLAEMRNPDTKEQWRPILQAWGKLRRDKDGTGYWCDRLEEWLQRDADCFRHITIDDCRYRNEYAMLRRNGFVFVRLAAHDDRPQLDHESEHHWPNFDYEVRLEGSLSERMSGLRTWLSNSGYETWA